MKKPMFIALIKPNLTNLHLISTHHIQIRKILVIGWDSGDLYLYVEDTCLKVDTTHSSSIHLAQLSGTFIMHFAVNLYT
jgi:hypothetical protein